MVTFDFMFNQMMVLWDFNFTLNDIDEFNEIGQLDEAYDAIYRFLFQLGEEVEDNSD